MEDEDAVKQADDAALAQKWQRELSSAEKHFKDWQKRGNEIVRRYLAEDQDDPRSRVGAKYNILWSNVQTLRPALFSKAPTPEVVRTQKDRDPVGVAASEVLERVTGHVCDKPGFENAVRMAVEDMLLPGRGVAWVRYRAVFGERQIPRIPVYAQMAPEPMARPAYLDADGNEVDGQEVKRDNEGLFVDGEPYEPVDDEDVEIDHVPWRDFLHSPEGQWDHVRWVARRMRLTKKQVKARFGTAIANELSYKNRAYGTDEDGRRDEDIERQFGREHVWEIWDKESRSVIWMSRDYKDRVLDQVDDPLGLEGFFPCPRPLLATHATDSLVPVPDFKFYEDQAEQIDILTSRIDLLSSALRVAGVYNASIPELRRLVEEADENELIPVENWAYLAEGKGLDGAIDFLPVREIAETLMQVIQTRQQVKQDLYEVTGISDILRGVTNANETATAQRIKGNFATLRLDERRTEVQRFARDLVRIAAEVAAEHFDPETMLAVSGYDRSPDASAQVYQQAVVLLRDDRLRGFRVDIETDSTIQLDEEQEKQSRMEFAQAFGTLLQQAVPMAQQVPEMTPLLAEVMGFVMRGFKAGRTMEDRFDQTMEQLQQAQQQQGQQQDPEMAKARAEMERKAQEQQFEQQLKAREQAFEQRLEAQKAQADMALEQRKMRAEEGRDLLETLHNIRLANMEAANNGNQGPDQSANG